MTSTPPARAAQAPPPTGGRSSDGPPSEASDGFANALAGEERRAAPSGAVARSAAGVDGPPRGAVDQANGGGGVAHAAAPPLEESSLDDPTQAVPSQVVQRGGRLQATKSNADAALTVSRTGPAAAKGGGGGALVIAAGANRPAVGAAGSKPEVGAAAAVDAADPVVAPVGGDGDDGVVPLGWSRTMAAASASRVSTTGDSFDGAGSSLLDSARSFVMAGGRVGRTGDADRLQTGGSIVDAATRREVATAMDTPATATDAIQTATGLRAGSRTLAPADPGTRLAAYTPGPTPPTALAVQGGGEAALRDAIARHALSGFGPAPVALSVATAESITMPGNVLSTAPHAVARQTPAAAMRLVADLAPAPPSAPVVLRLHPADLGVTEVEIARRAGGLSIDLRVDTPEALRALEAERGSLEGTLRREGEGGASVLISLRERRGDEAKESQRATPHAGPDDDTTDTPAAVVRSTSRTI